MQSVHYKGFEALCKRQAYALASFFWRLWMTFFPLQTDLEKDAPGESTSQRRVRQV